MDYACRFVVEEVLEADILITETGSGDKVQTLTDLCHKPVSVRKRHCIKFSLTEHVIEVSTAICMFHEVPENHFSAFTDPINIKGEHKPEGCRLLVFTL